MICSAGACNKITTTKGLGSLAIIATDKVYLKDRCLDPLTWRDYQLILIISSFNVATLMVPTFTCHTIRLPDCLEVWSWSSLLMSENGCCHPQLNLSKGLVPTAYQTSPF